MEIIEKSLKTLEFDKILSKLAGCARLKQSQDLCINASIYSDIYSIRRQLDYTKEAKHVLDMALELPLDYVAQVEKISESTLGSYLKEEEILDIERINFKFIFR